MRGVSTSLTASIALLSCTVRVGCQAEEVSMGARGMGHVCGEGVVLEEREGLVPAVGEAVLVREADGGGGLVEGQGAVFCGTIENVETTVRMRMAYVPFVRSIDSTHFRLSFGIRTRRKCANSPWVS